MKWRKSGHRPLSSASDFVRQTARRDFAIPTLSLKKQRRSQKARIFVIEKMRQAVRINPPGGKIRRILIFDNHPESLRLVSRYYLNEDAQPPRVRVLQPDFILGLFLILLLIGAMVW